MTSHACSDPKKLFHLAVEVSTPEGSLAFFEGERPLWSRNWSRTSSHSELLTETLSDGLGELGRSLHELDFASVTKGPGSFTGLRVGINLVKTLGLSLNLPLVAPTTLAVLAAAARPDLPEGSKLLAAMNAFKGMVYWAAFTKKDDHWIPQSTPAAASWGTVAQALSADTYHFVGDGFLPLKTTVPAELLKRLDFSHGEESFPSALTLGPWAWRAFQQGTSLNWQALSPLYVRRSEAEEKRSRENS